MENLYTGYRKALIPEALLALEEPINGGPPQALLARSRLRIGCEYRCGANSSARDFPILATLRGYGPAGCLLPGTGTDHVSDIRGDTVTVGIILPLQGKDAIQGKLLEQAAQIALDLENANGMLPDGKRFALVVLNESEQWGQASNAIVQLITQDDAVAVITSTDARIAHQAEQIANKVGEPILTLSSDPTTTQINIPWIFRVAPSDAHKPASC